MSRIKRVALAFRVLEPHLAMTQHGMTQYARRHGKWAITVSPESHTTTLDSWRGWPGDGMIALVDTRAEAKIARELKMPVVNLSGALRDAGLPRVMIDHEALGRMAAEHLLDCGFRRFAYYGLQRIRFSRQRQDGFVKRIEQEGGACSVFEASSNINTRRAWLDWQKPLETWLKTLQLPVGLMAVNDPRGILVIEACARLGLRVPEDVAVIGVDNNEVICDFSVPTLSSVARSPARVGYEAAALLDRLMAGEELPDANVLIPPDQVVRRGSTDVLAIEDAQVAEAVRFVRENVDRVFGVESLLPVAHLSRRWLTYRFKQSLGVTPHEFICRSRVQRAKELLSNGRRLPLNKISQACGFHDPRRFRLVFKRVTGSTPAEFRAVHAQDLKTGSPGKRQ